MQFRTKARAVDLLGRGQIADLPTAMTELWKNGYDAYADSLAANLYIKGFNNIKKSYFIISDDGKGMSYNDIIDKWLVLGTDSKSRAELEIESEDTLWKAPRIKTGEKGIGRLSVAYLGNPMLMLTKKIGYPIQAIYFDWRILENYNLLIDDIIIPLSTIENVKDIISIFTDLKKTFLSNFDKVEDSNNKQYWEEKQFYLKAEIISDTKEAILEKPILDCIEPLFDSSDSHGTIFIVFNPIDQIISLSEKNLDDIDDRKFVISSLVGFTNPFKDINKKIETSFNIHKELETYNLLTSEGDFFDRSDFLLSDVYIKGEFDGNGNFIGKIKIYDDEIDYHYSSPRKKDNRTFYGNIPMELGYSQGERKSSMHDDYSFDKIREKVTNYGGLYLYRDDFRVLPYGRENADFLNFEKRRTIRAGDYYFSYRRMFGYIDLKREQNPNLKDKSSREGLINNAQYRAFVNDAIGFFIALAKDYFQTNPQFSLFRDKQKELRDQNEAIEADKAREKAEKIAFTKSLNTYPDRLDEYQIKYENLLNLLDEKLNDVNITYSEIEVIFEELQRMELERKELIPKVPKRYKPTETQLERLNIFEVKLNNFLEVVNPKREIINKKALDKLEIRDLKIDFTKKYNRYIASLEKMTNEYRLQLNEKIHKISKEYNERTKRILGSFIENKEKIIESIVSKEQVNQYTDNIIKNYNFLSEEAEKTLFPLIEHIKKLSFDIDEDLVQGAYKTQYDQMKYKWEQIRDTAQLGIAVEIIDHEFNQLYARINNQLNLLASNENVKSIKEFVFLEKNFKHLEDKYTLLSPLYRISGALNKEVSCYNLYNYLLKFFENQISDNNIIFDISESFKNHKLLIKEPIIHTVFINIINNALFWMRNKEIRRIKLDYRIDTDEIIIANSGEKIFDYRLEKIFELFYSQRPNGRGIGLYLSKQSLNEIGFDIYATNDKKYNSLNGACFVINKRK